MGFCEKCFWLIAVSFVVSVSCGMCYQWLFGEVAITLSLLPFLVSVSVVHLLGAYRKQEHAIVDLWTALLIWLYFPMAIAVGMLTAAIGCDEGIITPQNFTSPFLLFVCIIILTATTWVTMQFIRSRRLNQSTPVLPFVLKSGALQIVLSPFLVVAFMMK